MKKREKIIIDTDIGDDIDDLFALISAISLDFEIVGITTVFKNTVQRAKMVKKTLKLIGMGYENVPVFAGYSAPIAQRDENHHDLCQYTHDLENPKYTPDSENPIDATDFIANCCKKYGKDLTIAAIGPFTNIAKVIQSQPDALSMANQVVIMGGAYFSQYADWNVMCDVEAAHIMFSSLENLVCIGADVTHQLTPDVCLIKKIEEYNGGNPAMEYVRKLYTMWQNANSNPPFILHDALVMHYIADNSICKFEDAHIEVITNGAARGITFNADAYTKSHMNNYYKNKAFKKIKVASKVDKDKFGKRILNDLEIMS